MNNQTKIELLIDLVKGMEYRDDAQLEAFLAQASVTIRNIFGWSGNKYWPYFENIRFKPASFFASDYEYQKSWRRGKRQMIDLMTSMLTDPTLEDNVLPAASQESKEVDDETPTLSIKEDVEKVIDELDDASDSEEKTDALLETLNKTIEDFKQTVVQDIVQSKKEKEERLETFLDENTDIVEEAIEENIEEDLEEGIDHLDDLDDDVIPAPVISERDAEAISLTQRMFDVPEIKEEVVDEVVPKESIVAPENIELDKGEESIVERVSEEPVLLNQPIEKHADDTMSITRDRVFLVPGQNDRINADVFRFLSGNNIHLVVADDPELNRRSIAEQFKEFTDIKYAIVVLSGDHYMFPRTQSSGNAQLVASQSVAFQLGYLIGELGRERVIGLYEENEQIKRPTGFFDVFYVPYSDGKGWQTELQQRLTAARIAINRSEQPTSLTS